ncbi:MAG: diphosphate--fructose-6-phosphate 1-phosphotransferase [Terracidiphilus sp.]|nr:diphosphate--fructose-6-phosphate 1-phosphotransferase [Terracidiphilus sp.]
MTGRNLLLVQGGGPTQVLNATLVAIVEEARARGGFGRIFGARSGVSGLANGQVVDLDSLSPAELELLRVTPGAALGSSRAKPTQEDLSRFLACLRRLEVCDILFAGGNGTMRGAEVIGNYCHESGYEVQVLGVPKTVDNDIAVTDRCPGYASAARYVAQSTRDLGMDVCSLPQPVSILETMGRSVGWLAAASAAGKRDERDAPHMVYLPECPFEVDEFLSDLERVVAAQGWAVVVVAEGIRDGNGRFIYQVEDPAQSDALKRPLTGGVAQFLAETVARRLKMRCRSEKPGLLGRASMLHVSSQDMADAKLVGQGAVRGLLAGETQKMVSLVPQDAASETGYEFVPLNWVAEVERPIPAEWISAGAIPVKERFFRYLEPLMGDLLPYGAIGMDCLWKG